MDRLLAPSLDRAEASFKLRPLTGFLDDFATEPFLLLSLGEARFAGALRADTALLFPFLTGAFFRADICLCDVRLGSCLR